MTRFVTLDLLLAGAVAEGLRAAALVERNGKTIALAGDISEEEAMPLAALVMYRLKSADLAERLFAGEVLSLALDERDVAIGIAKRQLFVVAVLAETTPRLLDLVYELRDAVAAELATSPPYVPRGGGKDGGGSDPEPVELALMELGVSVPRRRGQA